VLGWDNAQKIAMMPPKERVQAIKALRANAIQTFNQLVSSSRMEEMAMPEMGPQGAQGAAGTASLFESDYGATMFGGEGL